MTTTMAARSHHKSRALSLVNAPTQTIDPPPTTTGALTDATPQVIGFLAWSRCRTLSVGVCNLKVWVEVLRFRGLGSIVDREEFPKDFDKQLCTELNWSRLEDAIFKTHVTGWGFWCRQDNRPPHAPPVSNCVINRVRGYWKTVTEPCSLATKDQSGFCWFGSLADLKHHDKPPNRTDSRCVVTPTEGRFHFCGNSCEE
ncbi:uncharacterized protein LOC131313729 isoform X2 [Rhododendron vialii]|uniref:uncharacterized protein LOC131313729 isoform X2 n=1 Tax=Rhododendron vialii TaxID=182163 RepID=UPI00265F7925|nr:uncharacterized protein LOC131313729 isoform X2 [Rhododendron vialii]